MLIFLKYYYFLVLLEQGFLIFFSFFLEPFILQISILKILLELISFFLKLPDLLEIVISHLVFFLFILVHLIFMFLQHFFVLSL